MIDSPRNQSDLKKSKLYKSTRTFSLQLADHDRLFAPRMRRQNRFWWLKLWIYLPALILGLIPSYKLGRAILKDPGYTMPTKLHTGEVFMLPVDEEEEIIPLISGRELPEIDSKKPRYLGVARNGDIDIAFSYAHPDRPKIKTLLEKITHPEFSMFVKHVKVIVPEAPLPASLLEEDAPKAKAKNAIHEPEVRKPSPLIEKELSAYTRIDGKIRLKCWKNPTVEPLGIDPLKPRKNAKLGVVQTAGPGEVVFAGAAAPQDSVVLVYHGGGVYTRYWGLRETRVQKGTKVAAGQNVGYVLLNANLKQPTQATWTAFITDGDNRQELKAASLLDLSLQLCETK